MKKKKRFYNNKKRGTHWTEVQTGRKIYFADKYSADNQGTNKFDRPNRNRKPLFTKDNIERIGKKVIIVVCGALIICIGYGIMDAHMELHSMPITSDSEDVNVSLKDINISIKGGECQPLSLDGSILQETVIDDLNADSYSSVCFDLKRNDGTVGYESNLATVQAYGAISSASSAIDKASKMFEENDIIAVGRISCYKDNVVPKADKTTAVLDGDRLYTDKAGNYYLNPSSDSAYSYLRGIIEESVGNGIKVFILDNYDLPDGKNKAFGGGYDAISKRLYNDLGSDIKLLKAVPLALSSKNTKAMQQEWKEKTKNIDTKSNEIVFCVSAKNQTVARKLLEKQNVNYIIFD